MKPQRTVIHSHVLIRRRHRGLVLIGISQKTLREHDNSNHPGLLGSRRPKRLRVAELSNWTSKVVSAPRTEFVRPGSAALLGGPGC
jgi:hypothetical protein